MKKLTARDIVIIILLLAGTFWLFSKVSKLPSLSNLFTSKPVVIDETPIVIKDIKAIAELVTVTTYDEVVVDSIVYSKTATFIGAFRAISPMALLPSLQKQLVLIGKGKVLAGTNLQKLDSTDVIISGDTVNIQLPQAEILDAIVNPDGFETFEERGQWSDAEVTAVKLKVRDKIIDRALKQDILNKANAKSKTIVEAFLINAGYKVVNVQII